MAEGHNRTINLAGMLNRFMLFLMAGHTKGMLMRNLTSKLNVLVAAIEI